MSRILTTEEHFRDLGPIQSQRRVPGIIPIESREVRYVEDFGSESFEVLFERLAWRINPPVMKKGGALIEGCVLTLPSGRRFQAISYKGDIEGWRQQVALGASALHVMLGRVEGGELVLEDGSSYPLAECKVEFS